jgi:hypothetical protein
VLVGNVPGTKTLADYPKAGVLLREEAQAISRAYGSVLQSERTFFVTLAVAGFDPRPPSSEEGS